MNRFSNYLKKLSDHIVLTQEEMMACMYDIMNGAASEDQMTQFLTLLAQRGETARELIGAARVMREKALSIKAPADALDCCGTGGDSSGTYNISTAAALVAAACGVPVAKHGNRSSSSKSGAADVLEAMGVNLDVPSTKLEEALSRFNFCFLMAPRHHLAVRHVMPARKKLGFRTIFNLLGPLSNPAGARLQLIGVYDRKWLLPFAETLKALGSRRAMIVHGQDGLDEISTTGKTFAAELDEAGTITERILSPEDFGLPRATVEALKGRDAAHNAAALMGLLQGERSAYRDIVIANAAAALSLHRNIKDLKTMAEVVENAIDTDAAHDVFLHYKNFSTGQPS